MDNPKALKHTTHTHTHTAKKKKKKESVGRRKNGIKMPENCSVSIFKIFTLIYIFAEISLKEKFCVNGSDCINKAEVTL